MSKRELGLKINLWIFYLVLTGLMLFLCTGVAMYFTEAGLIAYSTDTTSGTLLVIFTALWMALFVYILISTIVWRRFRELVLAKLTFSTVRDEREQHISGHASRAVFYSTLSILILGLIVSCLSYSYSIKYEMVDSDEEVSTVSTRTSTFRVNSGFTIAKGSMPESANEVEKEEDRPAENRVVEKISGIPATQTVIFLFLILWHVASYHLFTRKVFPLKEVL